MILRGGQLSNASAAVAAMARARHDDLLLAMHNMGVVGEG